jgi:nitrite reductase/ring-hydroxylating ferredoxin subunit
MTAASEWLDLCDAAAIPDPGSRGFSIGEGVAALNLFVVHRNGAFTAFVNRCPHTGAPLEWMPDQFLDFDNSFVQCALHGALFRPEDGYCLRGPCVGQSLQQLALEVRDGRLVIRPPAPDVAED